MNQLDKFYTGAGLAWLAILAAGAIGWVINVVKLIQAVGDPVTGMVVARSVGVIAFPFGAIIGWF